MHAALQRCKTLTFSPPVIYASDEYRRWKHLLIVYSVGISCEWGYRHSGHCGFEANSPTHVESTRSQRDALRQAAGFSIVVDEVLFLEKLEHNIERKAVGDSP